MNALLETIFTEQTALYERLSRERDLASPEEIVQHPIARRVYVEAQEAWAIGLVTAIQQEASEALDWLPWKWWKNPKPTNWLELDREMIDILHFIVQYFVIRGVGPEEFTAIYRSKVEENHARQDGTVHGREDYKV